MTEPFAKQELPLPEPPERDTSSEPVPEVRPSEHIAPETPPITSATPSGPHASTPSTAAGSARTPPEFIMPSNLSRSERAARPSVSSRKERYALLTTASAVRSLAITFAAAVIAATIFMWWTSPDFLSARTQQNLALVIAQATAAPRDAIPTAIPTPPWFNRVGVIAGHSGIATYGPTKGTVDPGAVCPDGFTEASVTMNVARQVVAALQGRGYTIDLLQEWDLKLDGYQAAALMSLHADSCENFQDGFDHSGFKSTYPTERYTSRDSDLRLDACIRQNYAAATGLKFQPGNITVNMTNYHAFHQIAPSTAAVILELGLLSYDRDLLQNHTDKLAQGIVNGLLCYLEPTAQPTDAASAPIPVPSPTS